MADKPSWVSSRFDKPVYLTHHASKRMTQRGLSPGLVEALIETGQIKPKDPEHWWIFAAVDGRDDNLICAAVISREALIVKTLMTHWEEQEA